MIKHRLGYLDKIVPWHWRKEGKIAMDKSTMERQEQNWRNEFKIKEIKDKIKKSKFETRLLTFEQYVVDKVNPTNVYN